MDLCSYKEEYWKPFNKLKKRDSKILYQNMLSQLFRIGMATFSWDGIDGNGIAKSRKIEEYLLFDKKCAIVETDAGLTVCKITGVGLNIYGEPAGYDILTENGVTLTPAIERKENLEGQIGYDNAIILTDSCLYGSGRIDGVNYWVEKYADVQVSLDQQMINQRAPLMGIAGTEGDKNSIRVQVIDTLSGISAMIIDPKYKDKVQALDLKSPFNVDRLNAMQHEYESRALSCFGVDSMQAFGKKERMIVDEVESNDEKLSMILADCMMARKSPLKNNKLASKYNIDVNISKPYRIVGGARIMDNKIVDGNTEVEPNDRVS
jgi:hypothetical protein